MGKVIASRAVLHENVGIAFAAKALACSEAIRMGLSLQIKDTIIEGGSHSIIKKCNSDSIDKLEIYSHIRNIISTSFRFQRFVHVR